MKNQQATLIFTDGSSRGNPGPGGYGAIIATNEHVAELGGREEHTTNNRMELQAAIKALESLGYQGAKVTLHSDSKYVIQGITSWIHGWIKNDWMNSQKKPVENKDLWESLYRCTHEHDVEWLYVAGHSGHPANERCDEIATSFADEDPTLLFNGPRADYNISLDAVSDVVAPAGKPFYLSMVEGDIKEHQTWVECEKHVKGKPGAQFKKVKSRHEADSVIKKWKSK
jgi:ribonuclease HI